MLRQETIRLQNVTGEYRLSFPLSERHHITAASLLLDFVHSKALTPSRSQLRVQVNGVTIAQWLLDSETSHRQEKVVIPPELLVSGYNELRFLSAQHYTDRQCESPASPELWTEINSVRSRLEFQYDLKPAPLSLAGLPALFDKKLPKETISLLFADAGLDDNALNWGGMVAQGIALRLDYAPFRLDMAELKSKPGDASVRFAVPQDRDVVVIAERSKLASFFSEQVLERVTGPYLGLFPVPDNPGRFVLLVSGDNAKQVGEAARVFAWMNFPLPDAPETVLGSIRMTPPEPYQGHSVLQPRQTYAFRELGFRTASRQGMRPDPIELELFLPEDLFAPENAEVVFRLHLAYNADMRRDSLIKMEINGIFEQTIRLQEVAGAQ